VLFALYALTAPHSVALEDDGLFILSSNFLGIEHPPGYPLFTLVGHLFSGLPFGRVAYRVHLASTLFGALSCAMLWMCARALSLGRLAAYLAAFGLGVSPVFWSQAIIAEVYTLNTFFLLLLVYLGLRACPPGADAAPGTARAAYLPWMAFIFGLSLSNHYPLMLLVSPAFLILLWPLRIELAKRSPLLLWLVLLGLLPYAWLVYRSWSPLAISFYGPLDSPERIWFFLSRKGYAQVDQAASADWLDRIKFFEFFAGQAALQFALLGSAVAAAGAVVQWRLIGRRVAAFLTAAFLMPSAVLLLLLGFEYNSLSKHIFHVYPLPSYAIAALWLGLGFAWLANRQALRPRAAAAAAAVLGALFLAVGARANLTSDNEWASRYAQVLLHTLPKDAAVFTRGESDLAPLAYFHMVEGARPDLTLYQTRGLILGNRLFDPLSVSQKTRDRILLEAVEHMNVPVASTVEAFAKYARRDRWLFAEVDKAAPPGSTTIEIPEEAIRFFEQSVMRANDSNAWVAFLQAQLRQRYAQLLAQQLPRGAPPDARQAAHLKALAEDFSGVLGLAEGTMLNPQGYAVGTVAAYLEKARVLLPPDAMKEDLGRYFHLRGVLRLDLKDEAGAQKDFETSLAVSPVAENPSFKPLGDLYRRKGDARALQELEARQHARPSGR